MIDPMQQKLRKFSHYIHTYIHIDIMGRFKVAVCAKFYTDFFRVLFLTRGWVCRQVKKLGNKNKLGKNKLPNLFSNFETPQYIRNIYSEQPLS